MKCPNDNTTLVITERRDIEIDYCPECRGVWLDRGELDKIIERSEQPAQPHVEFSDHPRSNERYPEHRRSDEVDSRAYYGKNDGYSHKKKRRESFIGDLFDF